MAPSSHLARICLAVGASVCTLAFAKLPAPSDEAKAKAAETAAKAAWTDKIGGYQLCKVQDAVAATYHADMKQAGKEVKPAVAAPPCADPGPFVYVPPAAPLEAAGAHSPPATAVGPPSTKAAEAEIKGSVKK